MQPQDSPDPRFMRLAIEKAKEGIAQGQTPFGACIARQGQTVVCVHNVVWDTTDITAHAEVHALRQACKTLGTIDLSGCTIYSTCEPCPMCFSACHWARISNIVYGARVEDALASGFHELRIGNAEMKKMGGSPVEITGDFLREEAMSLFQLFDRQGHKRTY